MWNHCFLHHQPNVSGFGASLGTAKILWQFKDQFLAPPLYLQVTPLLPSVWPSTPDPAFCKWEKREQWTHLLQRACEHGALFPVSNKDFNPGRGARVRATFTPKARGLQIPTGGYVCLLGAVSVILLSKREQTSSFQPCCPQNATLLWEV